MDQVRAWKPDIVVVIGYQFFLPDEYISKDGTLKLPAEIIVELNNKIHYVTQSDTKSIIFPNLILGKGDYSVTLKIGDFKGVKTFAL